MSITLSAAPFLTDDEIAAICAPLVNGAAQTRYLQRLGLVVHRKPNGRPLVARGEWDRVMVGRQPEQNQTPSAGQPNKAALLQLFQGGKRGAQAQGR